MPPIIPLASPIKNAAFLGAASLSPSTLFRPFYTQAIPAGFPSPAEEYRDRDLDLNSYLVNNRTATFFFRVQGDSMRDAGILDGHVLVVDRSIQPKDGHIVLAVVDGEYTVKRLYLRNHLLELRPENPRYQPLRFVKGEEFQVEIWGVVVGTVCKFMV